MHIRAKKRTSIWQTRQRAKRPHQKIKRKKDSRCLGSSLPPRSNPELSGAVAKYVHQEWFTLFYMGHVQTLHGQSRYHRQLNNIPNWQIKMTVQDRADWFARGLLKCIRWKSPLERATCPSLENKKTHADTTKELYRLRPVKTTEIIGRGMCFPTFFPWLK